MDENAHLHAIFEHINALLWETAQKPFLIQPYTEKKTAVEQRAERIGIVSDRMQKVIAAYFDQQTAMMQKLITDVRFSRFPMPRKRIGLLSRISIRHALWKAIRAWPWHERQDS